METHLGTNKTDSFKGIHCNDPFFIPVKITVMNISKNVSKSNRSSKLILLLYLPDQSLNINTTVDMGLDILSLRK